MTDSEMEDAIVKKAQEVYRDAWDLALATEDEELFQKVWKASHVLVVDDILVSLQERGLIEVKGILDGELTYGLTRTGEELAGEIVSGHTSYDEWETAWEADWKLDEEYDGAWDDFS